VFLSVSRVGLWYSKTMESKESKSLRILDVLAAAGAEGLRFTDIQRMLWEMSNPVGSFTSGLRGYWCTALVGGVHYHGGLLKTFATKGEDGRWRRNQRSHNGKPWQVIHNPPKGGFEIQGDLHHFWGEE
jgi:hypothetical protein